MKIKIVLCLLLCIVFVNVSVAAESNRTGNPRGYQPDALLERVNRHLK